MKNKKGFTLIELLAVIVILGLLMAIAIPSVTKYITESRKKTVVSTIGNYITAMVNEVNGLNYTFTGTDTIYAVPVECIALERGGTNPFGAWHQANDAYWAYVLVQYDDETSSYRYGYTFKDSAGYGLYPTTQAKLNEGGKQIKTGLELSRPKNGSVTNVTAVDNWSGFDVDSTTNLVVLKSEVEGNVGDGKTTCTLQQKGDNYEQVKNEKEDDEDLAVNTPLYFGKPYEIAMDGVNITYFFYEDGSMKGYYDCELDWIEPAGSFKYDNNQVVYQTYDETLFKISSDKKKLIDAWEEDSSYVLTLNQSNNWCVDEFADLPMMRKRFDSAFWEYSDQIKTITFEDSINIPNNISSDHKWDISKSQNGKVMAYIIPNSSNSSFYDLYIQGEGKIYANPNSSSLFSNFEYVESINNIELLDTSKVTDMSYMFSNFGSKSNTVILDFGNSFNTSNVTKMQGMFSRIAYNSTTLKLIGLDKWDTSNVEYMYNMFSSAGYNATSFSLGDLSKWNTSNVTDMQYMFSSAGYNASTFNINLSNWNTSKVTAMSYMFYQTGYKAKTFNIGSLNNWDTSKVTAMRQMFEKAGYSATTFNIGNLNNWNTSSLTNMILMFYETGYSATTWNIGDLRNWNTSKVTSMYGLFYRSGYNTNMFNVGDLGKWDVSNVTDMNLMFHYTGFAAKSWYIGDLSNWDTSKVTGMWSMFGQTGFNATTFNIGNLSKWNVSNVTSFREMFNQAGQSATTWYIGDLSNWDISSANSIQAMFMFSGGATTNFNIGDLSKWDTSNVTDMSSLFDHAAYRSKVFNVGDLSKWDISKVTRMSCMFDNTAPVANWSQNLSVWDVSNVTDYTDFNRNTEYKVKAPNWKK